MSDKLTFKDLPLEVRNQIMRQRVSQPSVLDREKLTRLGFFISRLFSAVFKRIRGAPESSLTSLNSLMSATTKFDRAWSTVTKSVLGVPAHTIFSKWHGEGFRDIVNQVTHEIAKDLDHGKLIKFMQTHFAWLKDSVEFRPILFDPDVAFWFGIVPRIFPTLKGGGPRGVLVGIDVIDKRLSKLTIKEKMSCPKLTAAELPLEIRSRIFKEASTSLRTKGRPSRKQLLDFMAFLQLYKHNYETSRNTEITSMGNEIRSDIFALMRELNNYISIIDTGKSLFRSGKTDEEIGKIQDIPIDYLKNMSKSRKATLMRNIRNIQRSVEAIKDARGLKVYLRRRFGWLARSREVDFILSKKRYWSTFRIKGGVTTTAFPVFKGGGRTGGLRGTLVGIDVRKLPPVPKRPRPVFRVPKRAPPKAPTGKRVKRGKRKIEIKKGLPIIIVPKGKKQLPRASSAFIKLGQVGIDAKGNHKVAMMVQVKGLGLRKRWVLISSIKSDNPGHK